MLATRWFVLWLLLCGTAQAQPSFEIVWQPPTTAAAPPPVRWARVLLMFSRDRNARPIDGPNWFRPEPFCGVDVHDFSPGDRVTIDQHSDSFPRGLAELPPGPYRVQAILHQADSHRPAMGAGNWYSQVVDWEHELGQAGSVPLVLNQLVAQRALPEQPWLKEIVWSSPLLERFHGRPVIERAAVVLPHGYDDDPARRYPVIYSVPGFGGTHSGALAHRQAPVAAPGDAEFIRVYLSGDCQWGHHVYADSATNGPRGAMLVGELIPHIEQQFRAASEAKGRFVMGHSSGGWSSLWLQVRYADVFGGVWSLSPDPVDFRDFQQINLYADPPQNMFVDPQGNRRPIARRGTQPVLWYDDFSRMDDVLGRGGQLRSFEAVFSPLGADGLPRRLWDRQSGQIDPEVARAWEAYDINLLLERNWAELEPKLRGKLHVVMGTLDTFYLEGATIKLADTLRQLGSDAQITLVEGADHSNLLTPELYARIRRQMTTIWEKQ